MDPAPGPAPDPDRHGRRAVWIAFLITMIGAAIIYKDKAEDDRSAVIRWMHQVRELPNGKNIWDAYYFPNPPIFAISLYPIAAMDPIAGALTWFALKATLAAVCMLACLKMAVPEGVKVPSYAQAAMVLLCLRPIMGDLHHANNNLIILSLVVATLAAWRRGLDVLAGLCLALAITYKVTPALFVPYFLYKRSWRMVVATLLGIGIFFLVVPGIVLGPRFNAECLASWYTRIISPYVENGVPSLQEVNQSMVGVLSRLLEETQLAGHHGYNGTQMRLNLVSWPPEVVNRLVKGLSLALVGLLAIFCRTRTHRRDDPRLFGEFALVVLTMLFVSERSWKHHFVTLVLPYAFLVTRTLVLPARLRVRFALGTMLLASAVLIGCTSSELKFLLGRDGHKVAQFYGLFFWSAVVLYVATTWRVLVDRRLFPPPRSPVSV